MATEEHQSQVSAGAESNVRRVSLRQNNVEVTMHGPDTGVPVLLLAGGAAGCHEYFPDLLEGLADARVLVHDRLGTGATPAPAEGVSVRSWSEDCVALLDQLGVERALLVGHSLGGALALQLLVDHPDRVSGALLLDPTPINDPAMCSAAVWTFRALQQVVGLSLIGRGASKAILRASRPKGMSPSARRAFDATFVGDWIGATARALTHLPAEAAEFSARQLTPARVPIVLASADRKPTHRMRQAHEKLAESLGAGFEVWPETGHSLQLQRPDLVAERTRNLLRASS